MNEHNSDDNDGPNNASTDETRVPPEARRLAVLEFLDEHSIPLPPRAIYRGMKHQMHITFAYRTVQSILAELLESGDVIRVDKDVVDESGEIKPLDPSDEDRRTYYYITEQGRERIQ